MCWIPNDWQMGAAVQPAAELDHWSGLTPGGRCTLPDTIQPWIKKQKKNRDFNKMKMKGFFFKVAQVQQFRSHPGLKIYIFG